MLCIEYEDGDSCLCTCRVLGLLVAALALALSVAPSFLLLVY